MPIYTARVGNSCDTVRDICTMYVPLGCVVLDATFSKGRFWKHFPDRNERWEFLSNDIDPELGSYHYDCRNFPDTWAGHFDAVFLDPPFKLNSRSIEGTPRQSYGIKARVEGGTYGAEAVMNFYQEAMTESHRILAPQGVLVVKCMDQVEGGKQHRQAIQIWHFATESLGMTDEDQFVMKRKTNPPMRHDHQLHARKNHSFMWVFSK